MIHPIDYEYQAKVFAIDGHNWALPVGEPVNLMPTAIPDTWVKLPDDLDDAFRVLALRHSLDEWHLAVRRAKGMLSRFCIGDKVWDVFDGVHLEEAITDRIETMREDLRVPAAIEPFVDWDRWEERQRERPRAEWLAPFDHGEDRVEIQTDIGPMPFYIYRLK